MGRPAVRWIVLGLNPGSKRPPTIGEFPVERISLSDIYKGGKNREGGRTLGPTCRSPYSDAICQHL
eukprot:2106727-Heterocapsa_arctica.AAC.1